MDSRLLIGPGIPTPDPTARAPWNISSISPHRLLELSPVATAVSIRLPLCLFCFWQRGGMPLGVPGELLCAAPRCVTAATSAPEQLNTNSPHKQANKLSGFCIYEGFSFLYQIILKIVRNTAWGRCEWANCLWMNESHHPLLRICAPFIQHQDVNGGRTKAQTPLSPVFPQLVQL